MVVSNLTVVHEAWFQQQARVEDLFQRGELQPVLLHHALLLTIPPFVAAMAPSHSVPCIRKIRLLAYLWTVAMGFWILRNCRASYFANGFWLGLMVASHACRWASLLVFRDVETDFRRIERHTVAGQTTTDRWTFAESSDTREKEHNNKQQNRASECNFIKVAHQREREVYQWQGYPRNFWHRVSWIFCLSFSHRGSAWNWRSKTSPPLPKRLLEQLAKHPDDPVDTGDVPFQPASVFSALAVVCKAYIRFRLFKLVAMGDPYFWGEITSDMPIPGTSIALPATWTLVRGYRTFLCTFAAHTAMTFVHAIVCFMIILLAYISPKLSNILLRQPADQDWLYPSLFGPFSAVFDRGLAGMWGTWWHQYYRFDFLSCSKWVMQFLPQLVVRSRVAHGLVQTVIGFAVSGLDHGLGSYTAIADTRPLTGTALFYGLHAVGVIVQGLWSTFVAWRLPFYRRIPPRFLGWANVVVALGYFHLTAPLMLDDYARCGIWLTELGPLNIQWNAMLSGGGAWFDWDSNVVQVWRGSSWWTSGIRIL